MTRDIATQFKLLPNKRPKTWKVQQWRFWAQVFSLLLNVWIGVEFYLWVRFLRSGGETWFVSRPEGVEAWLPVGSLVSLRYWIETGIVNLVHPAGLFILLIIVAMAFLFKKGFCSWVCPVGLISELFGDLSDRLFKRRVRVWRWLDYVLRSLKYLLLLFFVYAIWVLMSPPDIRAFVYSDYNIVSDILMLRFFESPTLTTAVIVLILVVGSLFLRGFWCRYLCPYGALLGLIGLISPSRIRRNESTCTNCTLCARACPSFIKVDQVKEVVSDECTGCMRCVSVCPVKDTLQVTALSRKKTVPVKAWAIAAVLFFWGSLLVVRTIGPWENEVTTQQYIERIGPADRGEYAHP